MRGCTCRGHGMNRWECIVLAAVEHPACALLSDLAHAGPSGRSIATDEPESFERTIFAPTADMNCRRLVLAQAHRRVVICRGMKLAPLLEEERHLVRLAMVA